VKAQETESNFVKNMSQQIRQVGSLLSVVASSMMLLLRPMGSLQPKIPLRPRREVRELRRVATTGTWQDWPSFRRAKDLDQHHTIKGACRADCQVLKVLRTPSFLCSLG
jgi:hypothetical protein